MSGERFTQRNANVSREVYHLLKKCEYIFLFVEASSHFGPPGSAVGNVSFGVNAWKTCQDCPKFGNGKNFHILGNDLQIHLRNEENKYRYPI